MTHSMNTTCLYNRCFLLFVFVIVLGFSDKAYTEDMHKTGPSKKNQINLSSELKHILSMEMNAIQKGMIELVPAIASGNWQKIEEIGEKIRDSYIMKQRLSKDQIEELHHSLPPMFQELDHSFHKAAGMLAHTAKMKNTELVSFYFYKLNDACTKCHSKYATRRFPSFIDKSGHDEHHH